MLGRALKRTLFRPQIAINKVSMNLMPSFRYFCSGNFSDEEHESQSCLVLHPIMYPNKGPELELYFKLFILQIFCRRSYWISEVTWLGTPKTQSCIGSNQGTQLAGGTERRRDRTTRVWIWVRFRLQLRWIPQGRQSEDQSQRWGLCLLWCCTRCVLERWNYSRYDGRWRNGSLWPMEKQASQRLIR